MADSAATSFSYQTNALFRKNLTYQKRNKCTNICLVCLPIVLCSIIAVTQMIMDRVMKESQSLDTKCEILYGDCPDTPPPEWAPLLQIPKPEFRAVKSGSVPFLDLPNEACRRNESCPVTVLLTGDNPTFGKSVSQNIFSDSFNFKTSDPMHDLASSVAGTEQQLNYFLDPAFSSFYNISVIQNQCTVNTAVPIRFPSINASHDVRCVEGLNLWRNSSSQINSELYKGFYMGNPERKVNEIVAGYDFLNSDVKRFNVSIWYNSTNKYGYAGLELIRVPRSINLASNAYLKSLRGPGTQLLFEFLKEIPTPNTPFSLDFTSLLGALFFDWVILQLFPVVLASLVYEKQEKLRIMMKMHGLGDGPYWVISYAYFLTISSAYMLFFVAFGSVLGLKFFTYNAYSIQFVFYFLYINLQISLAFLVAAMFSNVKTATVIGYIFIFATGLLSNFLFEDYVEDPTIPRIWIIFMELYPGFALHRGLYEFIQYSSRGSYFKIDGMIWTDLTESRNGMREVLIIMVVEWLVVLFVACYIDRITSSGNCKGPLRFRWKKSPSPRETSLNRQEARALVQIDKPDVFQELEKVEQLLLQPSTSHVVICDDIKKIYPGKDGNQEKIAVSGLSLALPPGECFGMLGPNGAGKTSFISMMIGLTKPTSGTAFVHGLDIRSDMDRIYTSMGVCPQENLLWETLTGREHLLFYGRLKNLKGPALTQAVEESLKNLYLFYGGVADKQAGKYSGGMKRRLSVAISLIGNPKVVFMDEPSTGLDPAGRYNLWSVIKRAKQGRAIILTTHSMEEAEALCDRIGILVDGSMQCIGNPKQLRARYGGSYVLTVTTSEEHEKDIENMLQRLCPNANKIYQISGTQKFEVPKHEVRIADVFKAVENAKRMLEVFAWGLADTSLEDVFIKVATSAETVDMQP